MSGKNRNQRNAGQPIQQAIMNNQTTDTPDAQQQVQAQPDSSSFIPTPTKEQTTDILGKHITYDIQDPVNTVKDATVYTAELPVAKPVDPLAVNPFTSVSAKLVFEELKHYVDSMSNKKIALTAHQGGVLQAGLYRALVGAINAPAEEFTQVMNLFLAVIEGRMDTVFSASSVFRFMSALTLPAPAIKHFRMLTNMFIAMAPVKSRKLAIRQSGLPGVLNHRSITEEGRQRAIAYFGL